MICVQIPDLLKDLCDGQGIITFHGHNLYAVASELKERYPILFAQLFDNNLSVRQFVGLFLNGDQVLMEEGGNSSFPPDSELLIVLSVAGG